MPAPSVGTIQNHSHDDGIADDRSGQPVTYVFVLAYLLKVLSSNGQLPSRWVCVAQTTEMTSKRTS